MVTGKSIGTHPVEVKRVSTDDELKSCQLIFLRSSAGRKRTQAAVSALASASVLLVGEDEGFSSATSQVPDHSWQLSHSDLIPNITDYAADLCLKVLNF